MAAPLTYNVFLYVSMILTGLLAVRGVLGGGVECEKLPVEMCAFAVSSSGVRCVLEKQYNATTNHVEYECQSSGVMAEKMMEWIESEECLQACGLERMSVGLSSDGLAEYSPFTNSLCSEKCQKSCPNIADLFLNLAAGEGMYLPHVCKAHKERSRRTLFQKVAAETASDRSLASVPVASASLAWAPTAL